MTPILKLRTTRYDFQEICEWVLEQAKIEEKDLLPLLIIITAAIHRKMPVGDIGTMVCTLAGLTEVDIDWLSGNLGRRLGRQGATAPDAAARASGDAPRDETRDDLRARIDAVFQYINDAPEDKRVQRFADVTLGEMPTLLREAAARIDADAARIAALEARLDEAGVRAERASDTIKKLLIKARANDDLSQLIEALEATHDDE
jgi:hypothetical protein